MRNGKGDNAMRKCWAIGLIMAALEAVAAGGSSPGGEDSISVWMSSRGGLSVNSAKIGPVAFKSSVVAVEPPWAAMRFYSGSSPVAIENHGASALMKSFGDTSFRLDEYSAAVGGHTVTVRLRGLLLRDEPTIFEYSAMAIPDFIVAGASYSAVLEDGSKVSGTISEPPVSKEKPLADKIREIEFVSAYGRLKISVASGPSFQLYDRRKDDFAGISCLWIGIMSMPLTIGQEVSSEYAFTFESSPDIKAKMPLPLENADRPAPVAACEFSLVAAPEQPKYLPVTIPHHKKSFGRAAAGGSFNQVAFSGDIAQVDRARLEKAAAMLGGAPVPLTVSIAASADGLTAPDDPEGYAISRSDDRLLVLSRTPRGAFYAIQTLRDTDLGELFEIVDYPDLEYRAIHLFAGADLTTFGAFQINEILSRAKINRIVLECEQGHWKALGGPYQPDAATLEQMIAFKQLCDDNYIEIVPLFQTLGHCEWLFYGGRHLELAEDPQTPYAYNPSDPAVYKLMDRTLEEVIGVFKPREIHIGHDEIDSFGRFPCRPENIEIGVPELFRRDIMHYHDFLAARGIRMMMWHDMIMSSAECPGNGKGLRQGEVKWFRDKMPKDIAIAFWQYSGESKWQDFTEIKMLGGEGFPVVGCTWYEKNNIENMAKAVKKYGAEGLMGTSWVGMGCWDTLSRNFFQYATYPRVGAWAWHVTDENTALNGTFDRWLLALCRRNHIDIPSPAPTGRGRTVDIGGVANILLSDALDFEMPRGPLTVGGVPFVLPERGGKPAAAALRSPGLRNYPDGISIPLSTRFHKLYLLHTVTGKIPEYDEWPAELKINYADDGEPARFPLRYNQMIGHFSGECGYRLNDTNFITLPGGRRLWRLEVDNPQPDREVKSISVEGADYLLFGCTLGD